MPSSNPAFSRSAVSGTAQQAAAGARAGAAVRRADPVDPYAAPSPYAATTTRYMTMDDVVTKTGLTFLVTVLAAAAASGRCPATQPLGPRAARPSSSVSCSAW